MSSGGGRRTRTKLLQVALVLGLILISLATITSLAPGGPLWGNSILPPATTSPPARQMGFLGVDIAEDMIGPCQPARINASGLFSAALPPTNSSGVAVSFLCAPNILSGNVTFKAVQQGVPFPERHIFAVPIAGGGENTISVEVGNYSVTTQNTYFNISTFATVVQGGTTMLNLQLTETVIVPQMTEATDQDLSGVLGSWGAINVLLQTGTSTLYRNEPVFLLDSYYPIGGCTNCPSIPSFGPFFGNATAATVKSIANNPYGYWATLVPRSPIELKNLGDTWVVLISTTYQVVMPTSLVVSTVVSSV